MSAVAVRFAVVVAALVSIQTRSVPAQQPAHSHAATADTAYDANEAAVAATIRALFAAIEAKDLRALDTLYSGDSLTVVEGAGVNRGWKDYRDTHLGPELREFRNFRYRPFEIETHVAGSVAWSTFRYAMIAQMGERTMDMIGRGTAILERSGNRWMVRHTHTSGRARRAGDPAIP